MYALSQICTFPASADWRQYGIIAQYNQQLPFMQLSSQSITGRQCEGKGKCDTGFVFH